VLAQLAVRFNKFVTSVGYLTARENEVELMTTKFYNLHIVSVKMFHHKSVCRKIEGVQLTFVQIQHLKAKQCSVSQKTAPILIIFGTRYPNILITYADDGLRVGVHLRLSVYLQTWHRNVQWWVLETNLFCGQGHESQEHCRCGSLHSCECWLLVRCTLLSRPYLKRPSICTYVRTSVRPQKSFFDLNKIGT